MSYLYGKISARGRQDKIRKILQIDKDIFPLASRLIDDQVPYNQDTILEDGQWFFIASFESSKYANEIIKKEIISAEHNSLSRKELEKIDFFISVSPDKDEICFQKVRKNSVIEKKGIILAGDEFRLLPQEPLLVIEKYPDAIYKKSDDKLYFRSVTVLSYFFHNIEELVREATDDETKEFLEMDFITVVEGFSVEQVNILNRKRIVKAKSELTEMDEQKRKRLGEYIAEYVSGISDAEGRFVVRSNEDLKNLLYGIDQRYYTTPINNEKRIANSIIICDT